MYCSTSCYVGCDDFKYNPKLCWQLNFLGQKYNSYHGVSPRGETKYNPPP